MKSLLKKSDFVRWILMAALLCGVYFETGIYTVATLALISLALELSTILRRKDKRERDWTWRLK